MTPKAVAELQASLATDVLAFLPEVVLCSTIVVLLLIRLVPRFDRVHLGSIALIITLYALFVAWAQWAHYDYDPRLDHPEATRPSSIVCFGGMLVFDNFTIFLRLFLLGFAALVIWLSLLTGVVIGSAATWMRQSRWRRSARQRAQESLKWQSEADRLARERDSAVSTAPSRSLVLARR